MESEQSHLDKYFNNISSSLGEPKEIEEQNVVDVSVSQRILLSIDEFDSAALYRQF